jgi:hemolysin III
MKVKDPISALTHLIGAVLSCVAVVFLVLKAVQIGTVVHVVTFAVFGASLVLLYSASTIYHIIDKPEAMRRIYKRIDHMMIFVLIAGTYTPITLISLHGKLGTTMFAVIWAIAIMGIIMKALWIDAPRWLGTGLYILMGWLVVVAIYPLFKSMPTEGFRWLVAGGIIYTIGGIIYALKWPLKNNKWFGFHELFHLFILGGSMCHYILIIGYV